MSQRFAVYDADEVSLSLNGIPLSGYADGAFCRIAMESDAFSDIAGTDGEVARSKSNDKRATITIMLLQTSKSNDVLSALAILDQNAPGGAGVGVFLLRDRQGTTLHLAPSAWISKLPDSEFGREAGTREWTLRCAEMQSFVGSN